MEPPHDELKARALALVRPEYEYATAAAQADLERINRVRPESLRYGSVQELVRESFHAAGAVSTFAVNVGLLSPDDAAALIREFGGSTSPA